MKHVKRVGDTVNYEAGEDSVDWGLRGEGVERINGASRMRFFDIVRR